MASQPGSTRNRTSSSAPGSNPQRQPGTHEADTAAAAAAAKSGGGMTSGQQIQQQQAGQGQAKPRRRTRQGGVGQGQAGQGQAALPQSAIRETTVRSYDPHVPGAQQAQAGPSSHVRETTTRAYDHNPPGSSARQVEAPAAAGPSSQVGQPTARAHGSSAVRPTYLQAATPKQSVDALSGRLSEAMLDDGPTPCRGPVGTAPPVSSPVYGAPGDERVYTQEERSFALRLLDEGKSVYYVAKVTNTIIKTVQKWQKCQKELQQRL